MFPLEAEYYLESCYFYTVMDTEFTPEWFDASSAAWRANKKRKGESWVYLCSHDLCKRVSVGISDTCSRHCGSSSHSQLIELFQGKGSLATPVAAAATAGPKAVVQSPAPSTKQETPSPLRKRLRRHIDVSPTVPKDQGVAYRVVSRRRGNPSR